MKLSKNLSYLFFIGLTVLVTAMSAQAGDRASALAQAPSFYRGTLGRFQITALSDGIARRDLEDILSKRKEVQSIIASYHEHEPIPISINAYLVKTGSHLVLIDTGAGELFGSTSGKIVSSMESAGFSPDQIDIILLTHIHGDHSGGLTVGGRRVFPNATVYVSKKDIDYWLDKDNKLKAPDDRRTVEQSRATVGPYVDAGRVHYVTSDSEILPGIKAVASPGHTPGHTVYYVESDGHKMLFWGDTIHSTEVQFEHPGVSVAYDVVPAQAVASRRKLLREAAKSGIVVASDHISFPGLGHVRRYKSAYQWAPLPYNDNVTELDQRSAN
ncbi:MBL fold metallo-hydrolase [Caballeronia sp. M23-90]